MVNIFLIIMYVSFTFNDNSFKIINSITSYLKILRPEVTKILKILLKKFVNLVPEAIFTKLFMSNS
jgi:hypothetical protein